MQAVLSATEDALALKPAPRTRARPARKIVVIGASIHGMGALRVLLEGLPAKSPGILIVQHMPERLTASFVKYLDGVCRISVRMAGENDLVARGQALVAPGNKHMLLRQKGGRYYVEVRDGPPVCRHRPSVDVLFSSAARYVGKNAVGVIMTGMGVDGARGMREMKSAGAFNIVQDEESCDAYGMPRKAIETGAVDLVACPEAMPGIILKRF
jgi:two-component system chemotaxis response regulator CheB